MNPWRSISVALVANTAGFTGPLGRAQAQLAGFDRQASKAEAGAARIGRAGLLAKGGLLAIAAGLAYGVAEAIRWESAFAGVRKTVDATEAQFADLEDGLVSMGNRLPATRTEIAAVAEAAGQLGIATPNIEGFTETMIGLGEATNLTAEDAAMQLARLANITKMPQYQFDRLGSAVVDLGNNFATTEAEIVNMSLRIASAATAAGLAETDILAVATALSSVGIEAEAGGSAISRVIIDMASAVDAGGEDLAAFATAADVSAEQFAAAWNADPAEALLLLVEGLGTAEERGTSLFAALSSLGMSDIRVGNAMRALAGNSDILADALGRSEEAWEENTALQSEVQQRYETTESKLRVFGNRVTDVAREIGGALTPAVVGLLSAAGLLLDGLAAVGGGLADLIGLFGDSELAAGVLAGAIAWLAGPKILGLLAAGLDLVAARLVTINFANFAGAAATAASGLPALINNLTLVGRGLSGMALGLPILGSNLDGFKASARNASSGLAGLASSINPVVLGIGLLAAGLWRYHQGQQEARQSARELRTELEQDIDTNSIESYWAFVDDTHDRIRALREELGAAKKAASDAGGLLGVIRGQSFAGESERREVERLEAAIAELGGAAQDATLHGMALTGVHRAMADELGVPISRVRELADELGLELTAENYAENVAIMSGHLEGLADAAGVVGDQIPGFLALSKEEQQEITDSYDQMISSVADSWGSATDVLGAFGGRQLAGEVQAGLAEIRAAAQEELDGLNEDAEDYTERRDEILGRRDESIAAYMENYAVTGDQLDDWYAEQLWNTTAFAANIATAFEMGYDPQLVSRLLQAGPAEAGPIVEAMVNDTTGDLLAIVNAGEEALREVNQRAVEMARLTHLATTATSDQMVRDLGTAMQIAEVTARNGGQGVSTAIAAELGIGAAEVRRIANEFGISIADGVNPVLGAVGADQIRMEAQRDAAWAGRQGVVARRNAGGPIPGPNVDRDVVPAMLTPGEFVHRKTAVDKWGLGAMWALNEGRAPEGWVIPGFNVGGNVQGLHPVLLARLQAWAAAQGQTYTVQSGYRSIDQQRALYQAYLAGRGNLAAAPGSSMHNYGLASDGNHWGSRNPGAFGLRFPVRGEPWHVEPVEARAMRDSGDVSSHGMLFAPLPEVPDMGDGDLARTAEEAWQHTRDKATEWMAAQTFLTGVPDLDPGLGGSAGAAQAAQWVRTAMRLTGVPDSWFTGLMTIARRESNYNPRAINNWDKNAQKGDPSRGIMQTIGATFRAHALPGMGDIYNPVHNIAAAIRYILSRYGDISRVQQANPHLPPRGYNLGGLVADSYDSGGMLPVGWSLAHNGTGRPEPVGHHLTPRDQAVHVAVNVEPRITVQVGNTEFDAHIVGKADTVVASDHQRTTRLERAGRRHG